MTASANTRHWGTKSSDIAGGFIFDHRCSGPEINTVIKRSKRSLESSSLITSQKRQIFPVEETSRSMRTDVGCMESATCSSRCS